MGQRPRILVTGSAGCAGSHLAELAVSRGAIVFGLDRQPTCTAGVAGHQGDITQADFVRDVIGETRPDWVFHLAAQIPGGVDVRPEDFVSANVTGTHHVLDAVCRLVPTARVLVASSSAVYGRPAHPAEPLTEGARLQPQSLYAVTKGAQDMMVTQFSAEYGLHVIGGRTFNQVGPREPASLVCATLAWQVARIEAGLQDQIVRAVTLIPRRDFTDVRDVVAGYWAALENGRPGLAYNICSGRSVSIQRVAETLIGLSQVRGIRLIEVGPPPGPKAIHEQIGDATLLRQCSGWTPVIPLEVSLSDLLDDCRTRLKSAGGS